MSDSEDIEPTLAALEAAAEAARAANAAGYPAPATPESLYGRTAVLVELLGRLRRVAFTLGNHVERAPSDGMHDGLLLATDDGVPAAEYVHDARRLLADAAAEIDDATRIADQALSALSHLKLTDG
jgi:ParB-like chromosome segregation protein Spo0J